MPSIITKLHPHSLFAVMIELRFRDTRLSYGTALCVHLDGQSYLVTAKHNLTGRDAHTNELLSSTGAVPDRLSVWFHHQDIDEERWTEHEVSLVNGDEQPLWRSHPTMTEIDAAAVPFRPRSALVPTLKLDDYSGLPKISPGAHVHLLGFPLGRVSHGKFPIWNTGALATELIVDFNGLPAFLIDCTSRKGNSGSPVLAQTGFTSNVRGFEGAQQVPELAVLGIYSGRLDDRSDLGIVWKLPRVLDILNTAPTA